MPIFSTLNRLSAFGLFLVALTFMVGTFSSQAFAEDKGAFSPAQKAALEDQFKDFIMDHPELIMMSVEKYQIDQRLEKEKKAGENIEKHAAFFNKSTDVPVAGNPNGDVTFVEFFDYNCGYCKKALDTVLKIIENDKNVRVVFMELPVLGAASATAATWALASQEQGKYFEFHTAMMESKLQLSERNMAKIAETVGLDVERLKKDAASDKIKKQIEKNKLVAHDLAISGTPAFIVGKIPLRGFVPYEVLESAIKEARGKK